ncbi:MAG: hypothetical protein DBY09_02385 [Selenomonadales bacterium]|nr:MAG: hypothetical protein DBY09_07760 [Selenomonadales bacterium]PWM00274.1 MAG: hypothetical protein DBY09_02385 [Selenomonadales bacterium]
MNLFSREKIKPERGGGTAAQPPAFSRRLGPGGRRGGGSWRPARPPAGPLGPAEQAKLAQEPLPRVCRAHPAPLILKGAGWPCRPPFRLNFFLPGCLTKRRLINTIIAPYIFRLRPVRMEYVYFQASTQKFSQLRISGAAS